MDEHLWFMSKALDEAQKAYSLYEVPVGVVVVDKDGVIIGRGHNTREKGFDPVGHGEITALRESGRTLKRWRLNGCRLYVTLEPCPMCLAAMINARIQMLVFGAYDGKGGALSLSYNLHRDGRLNHSFSVCGGIMHYECSRLMSRFFKELRTFHPKS